MLWCMSDKEVFTIKRMIEYIDKVLRYTDGYSLDEFTKNEEKVDATVFAISQIGELVKNISEETIKKYDDIEWIVIKSLRNKIVHDYDGINLSLIWDIINHDILELKNQLEKIILEAK